MKHDPIMCSKTITRLQAEVDRLNAENAVLVEQTRIVREALDIAHAHADSLADSPEELRVVNAARLLPLIPTPSVNRIKAAGMREAAEICERLGMATNGIYERNHECAKAIRATVDELEGKK